MSRLTFSLLTSTLLLRPLPLQGAADLISYFSSVPGVPAIKPRREQSTAPLPQAVLGMTPRA